MKKMQNKENEDKTKQNKTKQDKTRQDKQTLRKQNQNPKQSLLFLLTNIYVHRLYVV